ncbi:beta-N-acetylhexosaminidase [Verrucomicrobiota bacterium]
MNIMKQVFCIIFSFVLSSLAVAVEPNLLPTPTEMEVRTGVFSLTGNTIIVADHENRENANYLASKLKTSTGFNLVVKSSGSGISLKIDSSDTSLGKEGYTLQVASDNVKIRASTKAGCFYGIQSFLQLLPPEAYGKQKAAGISWQAPCVMIRDIPKYQWRAFMLDSGRQYQTVAFIKEYLDHIAMMKMNVFHWHLTEDLGWRVEIKKHPKLTEVGSKVSKLKEGQGFYTQEQIKDIVAYAARRHITVVPEIDIPGHSGAALVSYPELTCLKKPPSLTGRTKELFCGGRDSTYTFLKDVLDEVCELFPGEYIHIGGDEAPKDIWEICKDCQKKKKELGLKDEHALQIHMTNILAKHLEAKGRKVICWGDVVTSQGPALNKNIVISWWNWRSRRDKALRAGIKRGHEVICNSNYYTYLNFPLDPWKGYQANRTFNLQTAYEENPSDLKPETLTPDQKKLVIGMETCMWCDYNVTMDLIDSRVFPRILALAEQMWSTAERKPYADFIELVRAQYPRLKAAGIDYGKETGAVSPPGKSPEKRKKRHRNR